MYILQKANAEQLSDLISEYRPTAFVKAWGQDQEYNEMLRNLAAITGTNIGRNSPSMDLQISGNDNTGMLLPALDINLSRVVNSGKRKGKKSQLHL